MHELSLLSSVVEAVLRNAAGNQVTKVTEVSLKVGSLSGAVPEALYGSWPIATEGSICQGAKLSLTEVQATVFCPRCSKDVPVDEFFALLCPVCATPTGQLTHGREFEIEWVEWDCDEDSEHAVSDKPENQKF